MNTISYSIFFLIYSILVLILLDCSNVGSRADKHKKNHETTSGEAVNCPKDKIHSEEFEMKMALCRPNITVACSAKPSKTCFKNKAKLKATAFVNHRNGQCLIESNVTAHRTLRFFVEAKRVLNPNEEGSRSLGQQQHQRGKCLLKYVCHKKILRTITMECGSVIADENGVLSNHTRQRQFWIAPPNHTDFVFFSAEMGVSSDRRVIKIESAKVFVPGFDSKGKPNNPDQKKDSDSEA